jgi:hypothetical protein
MAGGQAQAHARAVFVGAPSVEPPRRAAATKRRNRNPGPLYRSPGAFLRIAARREILGIGCPLLPRCHSGGRTTPMTGPASQRPWLPRWATCRLTQCSERRHQREP